MFHFSQIESFIHLIQLISISLRDVGVTQIPQIEASRLKKKKKKKNEFWSESSFILIQVSLMAIS